MNEVDKFTRQLDKLIISNEFTVSELKRVRGKHLQLSKKPYKERYHQRVKDLLLRDGSKFKRSFFKIIDYDGQEAKDTVSVLFPICDPVVGIAITSPQVMIKHNVIIKRIFPVKNELIVLYHFND